MEYSLTGLAERDAYDALTQVVVPRPVAWVLSDNGSHHAEERWNLAPYSYFNSISSAPPLVMLSIGEGPSGREKDTHRNLRSRPEFVIHIASVAQAEALQCSAQDLPQDRSEARAYGIGLAEWDWPVPRVADAPIAMACIARQFTPVGDHGQVVVFAEVRKLWLRPEVASVGANGRLLVDVMAVDPLARLGKGTFARLTGVFKPAAP
jgi:flavin reductase (DIM6/NTAB) family NADH-FMN oxidoreductase RutF